MCVCFWPFQSNASQEGGSPGVACVRASDAWREEKSLHLPYLGHPEDTSFHGGISGSPRGRVSLRSR